MKGDAERCLAAGMDAYLAKPLQPRALVAAIDGVLGSAPAGAAAADRPSGAPSRSGVLDLPRLLERVGGDRKALAELVRIFTEDAPKQVVRIRKAIRENDGAELRAAAHALKGAVSNFAAPPATEAALRLQKMGESGHLEGADGALLKVEKEIEALLASLAAAVRRPARKAASRSPAKRRRR
jgi:HPt (histidine-containing phosphotransfer) domain-containing protein